MSVGSCTRQSWCAALLWARLCLQGRSPAVSAQASAAARRRAWTRPAPAGRGAAGTARSPSTTSTLPRSCAGCATASTTCTWSSASSTFAPAAAGAARCRRTAPLSCRCAPSAAIQSVGVQLRCQLTSVGAWLRSWPPAAAQALNLWQDAQLLVLTWPLPPSKVALAQEIAKLRGHEPKEDAGPVAEPAVPSAANADEGPYKPVPFKILEEWVQQKLQLNQ